MKKFYLTAFLIIVVTGNINFTSSQQLCEQFSSTTFPPTGWTNDNPAFCYRSTASGFGQGTGSAVFDFWNAPSGNVTNLSTLIFQPTSAGDSLVLDLAFCESVFVGDSLTILSSTNGGSSYSILVHVNLDMIRVPPWGPCISPFIPSPDQWEKRYYGPLPIGTNRIRFRGRSNFGENVYIDSVCIKSAISGITPITEISSEFSLSQNYPNPFNPSTNIKFNIPLLRGVAEGRGVSVQLKIYDVRGKEISILVNEQLPPGSYEAEWDGTNYPSGVYFYKLVVNPSARSERSDGYSATKKMLLIK